jgi:hypothetical protein
MIAYQALVEFLCDIKNRTIIEIYQIAQLHFPNSKIEWFDNNRGIRIDNNEVLFRDGKAQIVYNKQPANPVVEEQTKVVPKKRRNLKKKVKKKAKKK